MTTAKSGDTVKVHYTGKLADGTEFDSTRGRKPLEFTLGTESVIPGFEKIVAGMQPGETRTETIASAEAYGERDDRRILETERASLPQDVNVEAGQVVELRRPDGATIPAVVSKVTEESVTLDANHPLAGKDLTFEVELVEVG